MRFSDYFALGLGQGALDFVNVDVTDDVPVFIDPHAIRTQRGDWAESCAVSVSTFFEALLEAIQKADDPRIRELILPLSEPNETHLGLSEGRSIGTSLGANKKAQDLIEQLRTSKAVATGMVLDLEEAALFVDGIGTDVISDITTCLIRSQLVSYTQDQCALHGVDTEEQYLGPEWDPVNKVWVSDGPAHSLPRGPDGPLLLVPRSIVRFRPTLDKDKYFIGFLRPIFEEEELSLGRASAFVRLVHAGKKNQVLRVNKTALGEHLGSSKSRIVEHTQKHPIALDRYRRANSHPTVPPGDEDFAEKLGDPVPNLQELMDAIGAIAPGAAGATSYHRAVAAFLSALWVGTLGNQRIEMPLHQGLKRIDITYDNVAADGFFYWLHLHYKSAIIPVECKNYTKEPANPELDQIAMRLAPQRGQVGLMVARSIQDKQRFRARCKAAANDGHGYVIALDDEDLQQLVDDYTEAVLTGASPRDFPYLRGLFDDLVGF